MLAIFDVKIFICDASVMSRVLGGSDVRHHIHSSQPQVSKFQKDGPADHSSSSTHTQTDDSPSSFASQKHRFVSDVGRLTSANGQQIVSETKDSDLTTNSPYFSHMKATMSHTVTRELKKSFMSHQKSIKEDVPSAGTTFFTERNERAGEIRSKFESGPKQFTEKELKLPTTDRELSESNGSFHSEKQSFRFNVNDSENIFFSNTSTPTTNAKAIYESLKMQTLYEGGNSYINLNNFHETNLSSKKLISNFTSNTSFPVQEESTDVQVNKLAKENSIVQEISKPLRNILIKIINSSNSTHNEWSLQGKHSSNLNAGTEMSDDAITSVNTKGSGIYGSTGLSIGETGGSLVLKASEADDEKLAGVSTLINTNITESETRDSFVRTEKKMRLDANPTEETFSVVRDTEVAGPSSNTVYTEAQQSESRIQNIGTTLDDAEGFVNNNLDINILNVQVENPIIYGVTMVEINGSRVDETGGNNSENTGGGFDDVEGDNSVIYNTDTVHNVSSTLTPYTLEQDLGNVNNFKLSGQVNSDASNSDNTGNVGDLEQTFGRRDETGDTSTTSLSQEREKDSLRTLRIRDTARSQLYNVSVSEFLFKTGQNSSDFMKHLNSENTRPISVPRASDMEKLSTDTNISQIITQKLILNASDLPPGNNRTIYVENSNSVNDNVAIITHSNDTKFYGELSLELTDVNIQVTSTLTSTQFINSSNSVGDDKINHGDKQSENVTFNKNTFTNFITSTAGHSFTANNDVYKNTSKLENGESASDLREYYNTSETNYEFVASESYDINFSTPASYYTDESRWNTAYPPQSSTESHFRSTSDISVAFLRNDSASDGVPAWPVKLSAEVSGDLILGGLMMVHEREDSITCGPIMPQGGIQALETMLYTLDVLNRDPQMIPNVTIGAHILDDCDKDTYGLEMAVDFIKGKVIIFVFTPLSH
ncbi:Metabotropic glutamate receptor 2 [Zootermopsis nevadensis]|uniref:Metabotropic glutamate receptor 2 n=1 Tax=Zootermopsis nevadensis TaxID=136037 RepID=A0A067R7I9_ZOONE|nr:Metabotropic glutamate receptor 2 [Zootermopsis nevadensis]